MDGVLVDSFVVRDFNNSQFRVDDGSPEGSLLYHYTTADVLPLLLKDDGDFLCTHYQYLNDRAEFVLGQECILRWMLSRGWTIEVLNKLDLVLQQLRKKLFSIPWIASLSTVNDFIYQWNSYTDVKCGGYAIGFDRAFFQNLVDIRNHKCNEHTSYPVSTFFTPCLYIGLDDQQINEWCSQFFKDVHPISDVTLLTDSWLQTFLSSAEVVAATLKHKAFFIESEWRIIQYANFPQVLDDSFMLGGKIRLPLGIKRENLLLRDAIRSIIISPQGDRQRLYETAQFLKQRYGMTNCNLVFSQSPYRG